MNKFVQISPGSLNRLIRDLKEGKLSMSDEFEVLKTLQTQGHLPEEYQETLEKHYKIEEILIKSDLNWEVAKFPIYYKLPDPHALEPYLASKSFGIVRLDNHEVLKPRCEDGYTITQNRETISYLMEVAGHFGWEIHKAGALGNGGKIWIILALESIDIHGDTIERYVYCQDSHDGSTGLAFGFADRVVHCTNQFFRLYRTAKHKIRHTRNMKARIEEVISILSSTRKEHDRHYEVLRYWHNTHIGPQQIKQLLYHLCGFHVSHVEEDLEENYTKRAFEQYQLLKQCIEEEISLLGETIYALFNGVTRYTTLHMKQTLRAVDPMESLTMGGPGYVLNNKAYDFLLKL